MERGRGRDTRVGGQKTRQVGRATFVVEGQAGFLGTQVTNDIIKRVCCLCT